MVILFTGRRAIAIFAAAGGLPLLRSVAPALAAGDGVVWKGEAIRATLIVDDENRRRAATLIAWVVAEVDRLQRSSVSTGRSTGIELPSSDRATKMF
ncbi:hypothetical protein EV130_10626 [Rhizobium azibense]|uniref:LysR substrate binding domain-containing protein n=1 Tax=Rhizobium azibense TaxID=1136135 RepID=A0A4R3RUF1_9HYPH|nr:hypothetical protein [Rhizobium azibense]TCU24435.1 hypothetical protein EV130_10626 [Rhizobium azibense]TCU39181.1 hypothetical protein EV129_10326 [Rhizobium azibense]